MTLAPKSAKIMPANGAGASPAISKTLILDNGKENMFMRKKKWKKKKKKGKTFGIVIFFNATLEFTWYKL
jgi:hypothetical protein